MALTRIGSTQIIQSLDPAVDQSNEAAQLSLWYFADRDAELGDWPWPFANKYIALNQVSTTGIPANPEWIYSYRYPSDCLTVRRMVTGTVVTNAQITPPATTAPNQQGFNNLIPFRQDGDPYPYPFDTGSDDTGQLIFTDCPNAWIQYTFQQQDPTQFSRSFADMLAWRVAADCYGLCRDDKRRDYCRQMYEKTKISARANAMNEGQWDNPFVTYNSESIRSRFIG
jgi:hypothetical protein